MLLHVTQLKILSNLSKRDVSFERGTLRLLGELLQSKSGTKYICVNLSISLSSLQTSICKLASQVSAIRC